MSADNERLIDQAIAYADALGDEGLVSGVGPILRKLAAALAAADSSAEPAAAADLSPTDAQIVQQLRRYLERYQGGGGTVGQMAVVRALLNILDGHQVAWAPSDSRPDSQKGPTNE